MKKLVTVFTIIILSTFAIGCGGSSQETKEPDKEKYKTYEIGVPGVSGNYQVKVDNYENKNVITTFDGDITTENNFIVVNIQIAGNDQLVEYGYSLMDFILVDEQGKTYATHDITNALNVTNKRNHEYVGIYDTLNPNVWKKTQIVFEVPKEVNPQYIANKNDGSTTFVQYRLK